MIITFSLHLHLCAWHVYIPLLTSMYHAYPYTHTCTHTQRQTHRKTKTQILSNDKTFFTSDDMEHNFMKYFFRRIDFHGVKYSKLCSVVILCIHVRILHSPGYVLFSTKSFLLGKFHWRSMTVGTLLSWKSL